MKKARNSKTKVIERAHDVPVTQKMLYTVRDELKSDIKGLRSEMSSKFEATNSEIRVLRHDVEANMAKMSSEIHRIAILVEEQNAKNNIVLDGLSSLFHRQDRVEKQVTEFHLAIIDLKGKANL